MIPLKKKPLIGGGPLEDGPVLIMDSILGKDIKWAINGKPIPWHQKNVQWYIVEGLHTYQACVSTTAKAIPSSTRHKFYMEFNFVPVYSKNPNMLIKVSNALNIQIKNKVVIENM